LPGANGAGALEATMEKAVYRPLGSVKMRAGVICLPPSLEPTPVKADTPAIEVMTDLRVVPVATIRADRTVAQATQQMITRGVRLLMVVAFGGVVEGLITATDTASERAMTLAQQQGKRPGDLAVADLMVPRHAIDVLEIATVLRADVGDVVATLKESGRQHALVVDRDRLTGEEYVRGIFSATQIGRRLGVPVVIFETAHTFAQIEAALAR
jgi:CBS domain containing-hemolysin-like protein